MRYNQKFPEVNEGFTPWDEFHDGEYGNSDNYDFKNMKYPSSLHENDNVYVTGDIDINVPLSEWMNIKRAAMTIRLKFWDATRGLEQDLKSYSLHITNVDTPLGKGSDISFNISGGAMPSTDYYFVIELLLRNASGTDEVYEKYGGMIQGDTALVGDPIMRLGGSEGTDFVDWFIGFFSNYAEGFTLVSQIPVFGIIINAALFGVIPIIFGYIAYTEMKSWIPFISGD